MMNFYPICAWRSIKHTMPTSITICRIVCRTRMPIVPFFTSNFSPNFICHDCTIMCQITNREPTRFKSTCTCTKNNSFCFKKVNGWFINTKTCSPCNSPIFLNQMSYHYSFFNRNISFSYWFRKGFVV